VDVPTLSGRWITLEPLSERHRKPLARASDDHRIWATTIVRADGDAFDGWFAAALADRAGRRFPFAVRRLADGARICCLKVAACATAGYSASSPRSSRTFARNSTDA
jgi:hypothetical protein